MARLCEIVTNPTVVDVARSADITKLLHHQKPCRQESSQAGNSPTSNVVLHTATIRRYIPVLESRRIALQYARCEQCLRGTFNYKPQRGLVGVGQGSRVNSCKIITKAASSLPTALERQVWASKGVSRLMKGTGK